MAHFGTAARMDPLPSESPGPAEYSTPITAPSATPMPGMATSMPSHWQVVRSSLARVHRVCAHTRPGRSRLGLETMRPRR